MSNALLERLGLWVLTALSTVLLVQILPVPGSPVVLGASIAAVYWIVRTYALTDSE